MLIVNTTPVFTEYKFLRTGSSFSSKIVSPFLFFFFTQFFKSIPIPPVTPTVVRKIGEIPLVPATIGAILTYGIYGLACLPIHNATLLTPDILDEPTPIVPFSATSIILLFGCFCCNSSNSFCFFSLCSNIDFPCNSLSDLE